MPVLTLAELQARLGGTVRGDAGIALAGVASLETAGPDGLGFIVHGKYLPQARASKAGALIVPDGIEDLGRPCLAVPNPHATFARAAALLHPEPALPSGIHASAVVDGTAKVDTEALIGPGVVIGPGAQVGPRSVIHPGCVVGAGAVIGADCLLHPRVTVQHGCVIGDRVILHPGCVIGGDGFGLAWEKDPEGGHWSKVPQVGRAILEDDVEVGANTTIDRGALDDTVIERGAKLDNLIQIAHNCRVGRHTAIAACVGIAGSTRIGAYCQIGGAAMIIGHLDICDRVTVSAGTFVAKDIREPGTYTSVQPLMRHEDWLKNAAHLRHLDKLSARIRALENLLKKEEDK